MGGMRSCGPGIEPATGRAARMRSEPAAIEPMQLVPRRFGRFSTELALLVSGNDERFEQATSSIRAGAVKRRSVTSVVARVRSFFVVGSEAELQISRPYLQTHFKFGVDMRHADLPAPQPGL